MNLTGAGYDDSAKTIGDVALRLLAIGHPDDFKGSANLTPPPELQDT